MINDVAKIPKNGDEEGKIRFDAASCSDVQIPDFGEGEKT